MPCSYLLAVLKGVTAALVGNVGHRWSVPFPVRCRTEVLLRANTNGSHPWWSETVVSVVGALYFVPSAGALRLVTSLGNDLLVLYHREIWTHWLCSGSRAAAHHIVFAYKVRCGEARGSYRLCA